MASGMIVKIGADISDFQKEMNKVQKELNKSMKAWEKVGGAMKHIGSALTSAITVPIAGAAAGVIKYGSEYEAQMSKIQAITGKTAQQMKPIDKAMKDIGMSSQYSSQQSAEAFTNLLQAGLDVNTSMASMKATLDIAANGNLDLGEAASIAARELNEFEMKGKNAAETAKNMAKVSDILAYAGNRSAGGMKELSDAIVPVGGIAHTAGMKYEDLVSSLSRLSKAGYEGREAGQLMVGVVRSMAAPAKKAKEAQEKLGVSFFDSAGKMRPMADILHDLHKKMDGMTQAQQLSTLKTAFGTQAMRALIPLMKDGGKSVGEMSKQLDKNAGYGHKAADVMLKNLHGALKILQNRLKTVATILYTNLAPSLTKVVKVVTNLVEKFGKLSPGMQKTIMVIAGIAAAIGPALLVTGIMIESVIKISKALTILRGAATVAGRAMGILGVEEMAALWPIALIGLAIIALIAVFVIFHKQISAFWKKYIKPVFDQLVHTIVQTLKPAWTQAFKTMQDITKGVWGVIKNLWNSILKPILMLIVSYIKNILLPAWKVVFSVIGSVVSSAFRSIGNIWNVGLKPILNGIINFISGVFSGNWSRAWNGVKSIFSGIFHGIGAIFKGVINGITSGINGVIKGVNGMKVPKWVPGVGGKSIHIPTIPQMATGGNVFGDGQAIVGEAGPELITKLGSSVKVTPLSSSERARGIGGAVGGVTNNRQQVFKTDIHLHGVTIREEADIKKLAVALDDQQRKLNRAKGIVI